MAMDKAQKAAAIYDCLKGYLTKINWTYRELGGNRMVYQVKFQDLNPLPFMISIEEQLQTINIFCILQGNFTQDKMLDGMMAAVHASFGLPEGHFHMSEQNGAIIFNSSTSYLGTEPSEATIQTMMNMAHSVVGKFQPRFMMLQEGKINVGQFMDAK